MCDFKALTQDDITKRLSLDKSVIAKTVTKLEELGFNRPHHQRQGQADLRHLPHGKGLGGVPRHQGPDRRLLCRMTQAMTAEERAEFKRLLLLAAEAAIALED